MAKSGVIEMSLQSVALPVGVGEMDDDLRVLVYECGVFPSIRCVNNRRKGKRNQDRYGCNEW